MSNFNNKQIDFLKALAELFYEKIRPDVRFRNERIEEWCKNLPPTPTSMLDSNDKKAIDRITSLHRELERIDDENSVKGIKWGGSPKAQFTLTLDQLRETIVNSDVDQSIYNLYHIHKSVLLRAQLKFDEALEELAYSTELLQNKITSSIKYLPRYTREVFMNLGATSELYRLKGDINKAVSKADDMLTLSTNELEKSDFSSEDKAALCPCRSWALYYCCEAHLGVEQWDDSAAKIDRDWYFSETFSNQTYKDWTVPVLIRIIGNIVWEQRYPSYFESIADLVYVGTAEGKMKKAMRGTSVYLGRVRLKPTMPFTILGLVATLAMSNVGAEPGPRKPKPDYKTPIVKMFETLQNNGYELDEKNRDEVKSAILDEIEVRESKKSMDEDRQVSETKLADRGIGVGFSEDTYLLLPLVAMASDRGIGVG